MSRTIRFAKAGGPEVLEFVETQVPAPGAAEIRINVKAIGINRAESMWRNDHYIEPVKFPAGLGYEAAGIVDAVGPGVTGFAVGDEVNVIPSFSMNQCFTYGEIITVPEYAVVRHPKSLSFAQAASVWMMFVTAYGALDEGDTPMPMLAMIAKMPVIKGHNIWLTTGEEARRKAAVEYVLKGRESGALKPIIDREFEFEFDEMVGVHRYLEKSGQFGKVVVNV
jgi:NADPH:quinone reductase-like Zn-dependent oxidoreductase